MTDPAGSCRILLDPLCSCFNKETEREEEEAERTLRGLHDQRLAVLAHSAGVEGLHPGPVGAVEVEPVHRADGLRPHVHFLSGNTAPPVKPQTLL